MLNNELLCDQFLGDCIMQVHANFPWVHIVRGRPWHPASKCCVEKSHGPYKKALLSKLKEHNTEDWVRYMHVVQCEINNCPVRSRGDIKPYTMYYSKPNKSCYSSTLGRCYKEARTEYGLCLAKMVLDKIKKLDGSRIMTNDEVSFLIKRGDNLFLESSFQGREEEYQVGTLTNAAMEILQQFQYDTTEVDFRQEEEEEEELVEYDHDFMDWQSKYTLNSPLLFFPCI
jgi:hypothetical protein